MVRKTEITACPDDQGGRAARRADVRHRPSTGLIAASTYRRRIGCQFHAAMALVFATRERDCPDHGRATGRPGQCVVPCAVLACPAPLFCR